VGNALERGDGIGPYGDRLVNACSLEVVLPTGECIRTGFDRFEGAKVGKINRWGLGPYLDGLFSQSNFGIVTQMTFWLMAKPNYFQPFLLTIKDMDSLRSAIENLRFLQSQGVIKGNSVAIWNAYKMLASERQYPWEVMEGRTPLGPEKIQELDSPWKKSEWVGVGALYCATRQHARADRRIVKKLLRRHVDRLVFINNENAKLAGWLQRPLKWLTGVDVSEVLQTVYHESIFLGFPTTRSTRSTYWRKKTPPPPDMNPNRDRCGVLWLCPVVPFDSKHLSRAIESIMQTGVNYDFEPHIAFIFPSERAVYLFPSIVYDRDVPGEDRRAMSCHDEMFEAMAELGFLPYRLGIHSMTSMSDNGNGYDRLAASIKHLLDPENIFSPGRYVFCSDPHTVTFPLHFAEDEQRRKAELRMGCTEK
jgi:4-cresol dehydrogenase (hydroxylating)